MSSVDGVVTILSVGNNFMNFHIYRKTSRKMQTGRFSTTQNSLKRLVLQNELVNEREL